MKTRRRTVEHKAVFNFWLASFLLPGLLPRILAQVKVGSDVCYQPRLTMSSYSYASVEKNDAVFTPLRAIGLAVELAHRLARDKGSGSVSWQDLQLHSRAKIK